MRPDLPVVDIRIWRGRNTDLPGVTQEQIDAARADVARDMGW